MPWARVGGRARVGGCVWREASRVVFETLSYMREWGGKEGGREPAFTCSYIHLYNVCGYVLGAGVVVLCVCACVHAQPPPAPGQGSRAQAWCVHGVSPGALGLLDTRAASL